MQIELKPEDVQGIVEKAILDSISEESRNAIVAAAVKSLMTPAKPQFSQGPLITPLQQVFDQAVVAAARTVVEEQLVGDALGRVRALVGISIAELCKEDPYNGLPEKVGQAVGDAVSAWLRDQRR